jgi:hypothetical protein
LSVVIAAHGGGGSGEVALLYESVRAITIEEPGDSAGIDLIGVLSLVSH